MHCASPARSRRLGLWGFAVVVLFALALSPMFAPRPVAAEVAALSEARRSALMALPALKGAPLTEAAFDDQVVVVTFFASWCPPCHPEFDHLNALNEAHGADGVTIIAVNIFEDFFGKDGGLRLRGFLADKAPAFHVLGDGERVAELFGSVERIPTLIIFGRDGQTTLHFIHAQGSDKTHVGRDELFTAVQAAL